MQGRAEQAALISSVFPGLAPLLDPGSVAPLDGTFVDEDLTSGRPIWPYVHGWKAVT